MQGTWDVHVCSNVTVELGHEGHAEATDFVVRLALGVKVGATLSASHAQASEGVLEGLLESKELEDGQVDGGVKSETAFVGAKRRVVLQISSAEATARMG